MRQMTVIRGGTVVDGTGKPGFRGDVVVSGDKIVDVIEQPEQSSDPSNRTIEQCEAIDATGCLVTPGFIDSHAHSDAYLVIEPDAPSKISQGITTEINGQCGGSVAPRYGEARLSSDWAEILGDRLTWRSLAEYREALAAARPAVNTVQFIGHNTLRSSVVGYAGRAATEDELEKMKYLLEEALDQGGFGLTTGLIYQPGKYSTPEEVEELAKVTARVGGFYATHMRSESGRVLEAIDEVVNLALKTGVRAEISHLKTSGRRNWDKIDAVLEKVGGAVDRGVLLGSDRYPFCASGTDLDIVLPDWAQEGAAKAECARLADPVLRRRIVDEINADRRDWSIVMIGGTWHPDNKRHSGKSVREIIELTNDRIIELAESSNRRTVESGNSSGRSSVSPISPGELVCSILEKDGCKTGAFFFAMSEANMRRILGQPWIVPGSDASLRAPWGPLGADHPHPRAYATMPEFYRLTRDIARMTSVPARRFGLRGRGVLERGAFADIAVWREGEFRARATYTDPHRFAGGVKCVMVNGVVSYLDGRFTGRRGGRFLERTK